MEQLYLVNRFTAENEASADEDKLIDPDKRLKKILKRAKKKQEQARLSHDTQVVEQTDEAQPSIEPLWQKRKLGDLDEQEQLDHGTLEAPKKKAKPVLAKNKTRSEEAQKKDALEGIAKSSSTTRKKKRRKKSKQPRMRALDGQPRQEGTLKVQAGTKKTRPAALSPRKKKESDREQLKGEEEDLVERNGSPSVGDMGSDKVEASNEVETDVTPTAPVEYFPVLGEVEVKATEVVHRVLPDWLSNPEKVESRVKKGKTSSAKLDNFHDSLSPEMLAALAANKIRRLFPVQEKVVPWLLSPAQRRCFLPPRDICVSAPTGSGKTLAYVIPIVESLKPRIVRAIRAVVVLPVKELAAQVQAVFQQYLRGTSLRSQLVTGTKPFSEEQLSLVHKNARGYSSLVDIIVATPGRLLDHIRKTPGFSLHLLKFFVLDEADRVIEDVRTTLIPEVEQAVFGADKCNCCCRRASGNGRLYTQPLTVCSLQRCREPAQKLLYSATLTQDPEKLQSLMLFQPKLFTAAGKDGKRDPAVERAAFAGKYTTPQGLSEFYRVVQNAKKPLALWDLVANRGYTGTLCFTGTKDDAHRLCLVIKEMGGVRVEEFSSDLSATERARVLRRFASGGLDLLVCSNVLARGLDVANVRNVVCYDPPKYVKTYVHRVGRTARAGVPGTAVTFLRQGQLEAFQTMLSSAGKSPVEALEEGEAGLEVFHEKYRVALKAVEAAVGREKKEVQIGKKFKYARKAPLPRSAFGEKAAAGRGTH
ncbi:ATP-dependent RNA helicase DDX51 [Ixodes scapularis]